jgi:hypothetical protein
LLDLYFEDVHLWEKTRRTKQYVIKMLRGCDIAKIQSNKLKTSDLITHCKLRWDDLNLEHKTIIIRNRKAPFVKRKVII